ncbi:response regulator transcription factor [Actinomadura nitritigenes]|uniref:Response regulator transcription factor n=1 Tax=Actinomadura nitritigenes TaxID=134602 RepID=A0ABS3QRX4_9ACTN|nr:response regulator transcription factor [Actinomadura nitritigenes]MBO2436651.1 response regulator transcription factor [Actinomadura nitritigenes]
MGAPRVLVADDNVVVRSGLVSLLEAHGIEVAGEAGDGRRAVELTARLRPDLVLLDVRMPLMDGVAAVAEISPLARVLMLTYTDDPGTVRAALGKGATGYLVHGAFTADELIAAVHGAVGGAHPLSPAAVSALVGAVRETSETAASAPAEPRTPPDAPHGGFGLSAREAEVMRLIVQGASNGEIAARLFLAEKTVKNHVNRIYAKLGVTSRGAAIARWIGTAGDLGRAR